MSEAVGIGSRSHGRDDGAATRALQRASPPSEELERVAKVTRARSVDVVDRMTGGSSLAMHSVTVTFATDRTERLVFGGTSARNKSLKNPTWPGVKQPCWNSLDRSRHLRHVWSASTRPVHMRVQRLVLMSELDGRPDCPPVNAGCVNSSRFSMTSTRLMLTRRAWFDLSPSNSRGHTRCRNG